MFDDRRTFRLDVPSAKNLGLLCVLDLFCIRRFPVTVPRRPQVPKWTRLPKELAVLQG